MMYKVFYGSGEDETVETLPFESLAHAKAYAFNCWLCLSYQHEVMEEVCGAYEVGA